MEDRHTLEKRIAELEEQLKNALIPKFKVGGTVFVISGKVIKKAIIDEIYWTSSKNSFEYYTAIICGLNDIQYETIEEQEIFNTKKDAELKLKNT
ncbi:MAG: hypothetical protein J6J36_06770 [Clostridia bacterium]|nr:hypothetical protein [Clostridia bacterium]